MRRRCLHAHLRRNRRPRSRNQIALPTTPCSLGALVNYSNAQGNLQARLELHQENNPRKQIRHHYPNLDRGSRNEVPRGWESFGDERAYGDECGGGVGGVVST